jgi:hypothetical protein
MLQFRRARQQLTHKKTAGRLLSSDGHWHMLDLRPLQALPCHRPSISHQCLQRFRDVPPAAAVARSSVSASSCMLWDCECALQCCTVVGGLRADGEPGLVDSG